MAALRRQRVSGSRGRGLNRVIVVQFLEWGQRTRPARDHRIDGSDGGHHRTTVMMVTFIALAGVTDAAAASSTVAATDTTTATTTAPAGVMPRVVTVRLPASTRYWARALVLISPAAAQTEPAE